MRRLAHLRAGRGAQALRQLEMLRLLTREWHSVRELCDELYGSSYRTAYRDVEQLLQLGVPIDSREVTDDLGSRTEYRLRWARLRAWMGGS